ncbi:MAG: hypothetical protein LR015_12715 [Verrucomicrobia bacterium]|nr:hypothetical protein [Verrucomicrobiota bacterium]
MCYSPLIPLILCCTLISVQATATVPTNNPILAHYPDDPHLLWTDEVRWDRVFVVTDFPGENDMERYVAARDAAWQAGGGVVYFPEASILSMITFTCAIRSSCEVQIPRV